MKYNVMYSCWEYWENSVKENDTQYHKLVGSKPVSALEE